MIKGELTRRLDAEKQPDNDELVSQVVPAKELDRIHNPSPDSRPITPIEIPNSVDNSGLHTEVPKNPLPTNIPESERAKHIEKLISGGLPNGDFSAGIEMIGGDSEAKT